jgi:hypothetical protein
MKTSIKYFTVMVLLICSFVYIQAAVSHTKAVDSHPGTVAPSPNPVLCQHARIRDAKFDYLVSKAELMALDSLCLDAAGNGLFRVLRFNIIIMPVKGYMSQINCSANAFDPAVKRLFSELGPGDLVVIDGIRLYNGGARKEGTMKPISIQLR